VTDTEPNAEQPLKRRKSVRFSPTVESTTFLHSDPPSPNRSSGVPSKSTLPALPNGNSRLEPEPTSTAPSAAEPTPEGPSEPALDGPVELAEIENKEHFQLAPEEAFFLVFALGALRVVDPVTDSPISTEHLLSLFRSYSYFPPRPAGSGLRPDDPFLVNYAVYHHFRSLGWVPRHGIKFGVDWIIYQRGPVFDHSEFGIMVMPAYSDPVWEGHEHEEPKRSWSWLMGVNRVLSHVLKSLVLVYVDIPPPTVFEEEMQRGGTAAALKKYTIREVMVRRFSVNRNR
jgi:tRNA-splicing endonuclease subunit Sen2